MEITNKRMLLPFVAFMVWLGCSRISSHSPIRMRASLLVVKSTLVLVFRGNFSSSSAYDCIETQPPEIQNSSVLIYKALFCAWKICKPLLFSSF